MEMRKYPNLVGEMAKRRLSIRAMAEDLGVDRGTLSRWLSGVSAMPLDIAKEIRHRYFPEWELERLFE